MEINSSNLLDNIIYRANIFNYDTKFLNEVRERNLKLDLNSYSQVRKDQTTVEVSTGYQFLKQKSKDQLGQILGLLSQSEEEEEEREGDEEEVDTNLSRKVNKMAINPRSKDARSTFLLLVDIIMFSKSQISTRESKRLEEMENMEVEALKSSQHVRNVFSDNILYALLYLDGLIMFNIDIIKKLDQYSPLIGAPLSEILFDVLNDKFIDDYTKEVASHLLSADLAFANPEGIAMTTWKDLIHWTFDYYTQK